MSWGEVFKVNNKIKKPINKLLYEKKYFPIRIITSTGKYTPEKTGLYRVICVGAGGGGFYKTSSSNFKLSGGGSGGVAIKDIVLNKSTTYDVTVSTTASFGTELTATAGLTEEGTYSTSTQLPDGGTAVGGDYNFPGERGARGTVYQDYLLMKGGSVGVVIGELLSHRYETTRGGPLQYGNSLLGYGGGGSAIVYDNGSSYSNYISYGLPAAVIIIPLELEA